MNHVSCVRREHGVCIPVVRELDESVRRVPLGNKPIRIGNEIVGRVKSGGQGLTIGKAIGYGYLPIEHAQPGTAVEVELFGEWVRGVVA